MSKFKLRWLWIIIPLVLIVLYGFTYVPHNVIRVDATKVSTISVFDGATGQDIKINERETIVSIIEDLNHVTFQKRKSSIFYMGYRFRVTFYNTEGKQLQQIIMNSEDVLRYKGFFYEAIKNDMPYDFIDSLFK